MKRLMKWIIPLLLVVLLIGSAFWYMLVYDRSTVQDFLNAQARNSAKDGHFSTATWFYNLSYKLSDKDEDVAIELAKIYKSAGNYTKAEATLTNAIADGGTADLYIALCQTFVEQDKLLDAVTMLENIADPAIKAELDSMRPAAPTVDQPSGFYSEYITLHLTSGNGTLYVSTDGSYPTLASQPSSGVITLEGGETKVYALSIAENGLVSPVAIFNYTIGGVVEDVTLQDPAIDAYVRQTLMLADGAVISTKDLWSITEMTVPENAETLADLKHFIALKKLEINGIDFADPGVLSGMTGLQELIVTDSTLSSLSALKNMTKLQKLTLSNCSISSISDLAGLKELTELDLSNNAIGDISALESMGLLERVNLSDNAVSDVSALAHLSVLTELNLANNALTSISGLSACQELTTLNVSGNSLTDLSTVAELPSLVSLSAAHNALTNVDALSNSTELETLDVSNNQITSLNGISGLSMLSELNISHNQITSLPDLGGDSSLVRLIADYNQITDISALRGLSYLNYVYLDYNPELTDVSPLTDCYRLIQLNAFGTKVTTESVASMVDRDVVVNYDPT